MNWIDNCITEVNTFYNNNDNEDIDNEDNDNKDIYNKDIDYEDNDNEDNDYFVAVIIITIVISIFNLIISVNLRSEFVLWFIWFSGAFATQKVQIEIIDENDNPPKFTQKEYRAGN